MKNFGRGHPVVDRPALRGTDVAFRESGAIGVGKLSVSAINRDMV